MARAAKIDAERDAVREVLETGIKTVEFAREEITTLVRGWIVRGRSLGEDAQGLVTFLLDRGRRTVESRVRTVARTAGCGFEVLLHRVNLASRGDLEQLHGRLEELTRKLGTVERRRSRRH